MTSDTNTDSPEHNSLTVGQIVSFLRQDSRKIAAITFVAVAVSVFYAFHAPESWKATIQVVPTEVPHSEQLGALAEVLSKKAGSGSANIDLFSAILVSRPTMEKLLESKVRKPGAGKDSLYSVRYLLEVDSSDRGTVFYAADALGKSIQFTQQQNSLSNIVEVSLTANSDWLAKGMLSNLLEIGQASLFEITKSRYATVIHRLEKADSIAGQASREASNAYTRFLEANRNSNQPAVLQQADRLRQELDIRDQTYLMVRRELEQNRLEVEKIMPPVVEMDSAFVPPLREAPKRKQIVVAGFLLGILGGSACFLGLRIFFGNTK